MFWDFIEYYIIIVYYIIIKVPKIILGIIIYLWAFVSHKIMWVYFNLKKKIENWPLSLSLFRMIENWHERRRHHILILGNVSEIYAPILLACLKKLVLRRKIYKSCTEVKFLHFLTMFIFLIMLSLSILYKNCRNSQCEL